MRGLSITAHCAPHRVDGGARCARGALALSIALLLVLVAGFSPARAVEFDEILPDRTLEARARAISSGLRCLVCQNQSIDDSNAPLARDLRLLVRERLKAGDSDAQVRAFLVARYGDFVLLKPPMTGTTLLLWGAPFLILGGGAVALALGVRRRRRQAIAVPLSDEEKARLKAALGAE
ncbi:cytochrome c-type biogenesis protein [Chelatococcus asaccharovorans]|uniref:cytochrome c-type biogenesis protein n=1 Tax=Chelatococcus asaccharovorans TaxID=28210 RepID=UPI00224C6C30|nr:cytochrome c-type biogenesis protein [Chelatococcus asaccharovorans]CAH1671308.1 Cytochrome c-type biogenesis protein CcmH [Chelatococcus asaccharovorans]CAH1677260.1 Cytochrome c-type biogenesis protein CcmH [Chelatococcus asaccharovorans]